MRVSKVILTLEEMPISCVECPCRAKNIKDEDICHCFYGDYTLNFGDLMYRRPSWCPLKELPEKQVRDYPEYDRYVTGWDDGWDACLDEILGE